MLDLFAPGKRSEIMAEIKSTGTAPALRAVVPWQERPKGETNRIVMDLNLITPGEAW